MAKRKKRVSLVKVSIYPDEVILKTVEQLAYEQERSVSQQFLYLVNKGLELEYIRIAAADEAQRGVEEIVEALADAKF